MSNEIIAELEFLKTAERLKMELRHSWLSNGRRESVAEHSWRLALMVFRYARKLAHPINLEKSLKLAIIHDLAEAKTGDIPVFNCQTTVSMRSKHENENQAMLDIMNALKDEQAKEIYQLWLEYEKQETYESKFVKALDKLEALIQHNESSLDTWEYREKKMLFQPKWVIKYCEFDLFLSNLCRTIIEQGINKLKNSGENIQKIKKDAEEEDSYLENVRERSLTVSVHKLPQL